MKIFALILSNSLLFFFGYVFYNNFQTSTDISYLIYMSLLILIMLMCIVVSVISIFELFQSNKKNKSLHYNSYSDKRIKDSEFDKIFTRLHF